MISHRPIAVGPLLISALACATPSSADDEAPDRTGKALPLFGQLSVATEATSEGTDWGVTLTLRGDYDRWSNDGTGDESGRQYTETGKVVVEASGLLMPRDSFSVSGQASGIQSHVERGGEEETLKGATDTALDIVYSTFDSKADGPTSGVKVSVDAKIPTGETELTELERTTTPNSNVVSKPFGGVGLNVGTVVTHIIRWNDSLKTSAGAGYGYRGSYDPTAEIAGDDVSAGHEIRARLGGEYLADDSITVDVGLSFDHLIGYGDETTNRLSAGTGVALGYGDVAAKLRYTFNYSDARSDRVTDIFRSDDYRQGISNTVNLRLECSCFSGVTIGGFGAYSNSSKKGPMDATFFATGDRLELGLDGEWALPDLPLTAWVAGKYVLLATEGFRQGEVDFSGLTASGYLSWKF